MAEEGLSEEENKTEEPSERKKEKARMEGQVAYTKEIGTTLGFMAISGVIYFAGREIYRRVTNDMIQTLGNLDAWQYGTVPVWDKVMPSLLPVIALLGLILAAAFVAPLVGHILQKGIDPKFEAAEPKLSRVSFSSGFGQLFSIDSFINFLKNIVKTAGLMAIFYLTIRPYIDKIVYIAALPFESSVLVTGEVFGKFIIYSTMFLISVAGLDYFVSWRRLHQKLMMSRHELKEEMKDSEGNPHIKQKVRQIQHERAKRQIMKTVPGATVIITNPTHFAIAIKYKKGEVPIPRVVAKGCDHMAKRIREVAGDHRIPIIENPPLARALYKEVKAGREIPHKFYKAVAKIIAAIMRLEEEKKRQRTGNYGVSLQ